MPRYAAFLRGVSPTNARMPELKRAFERSGFTNVKTLLSSGNVVFDARSKSERTIIRQAEAAMEEQLGRRFHTIVRSLDALRAILDDDPYAAFDLPPDAKRVVTFLRHPPGSPPSLPIEGDGVHIVALEGRDAFTAYVPHPRGPVFMTMIEKTFGKDVTTRTWNTVKKCAGA